MPFAVRNTLAVATLAAAFAAPAVASSSDWEEEFSSRHWRPATLSWASDLHPDHPTESELQQYYVIPPHEMWCPQQRAPDSEDNAIHNFLLIGWLRDFLDVPAGEPLPPGIPDFPKECP